MNALPPGSLLGAIGPAHLSELTQIRWLLELESLPSIDLTERSVEHFLVCRDAIGVAGVVGLERYGDVGLLRSLVVASQYLGQGMARRLVAAAEDVAKKLNLRAIYLLTTDAQEFFEHVGFRSLSRAQAPLILNQSTQFKSLCPSSAVLMVKP